MIVAPGTELCKDGEIIFIGTEQVPCPICGGELKVHGTCKRQLETEDGENLLYRLSQKLHPSGHARNLFGNSSVILKK